MTDNVQGDSLVQRKVAEVARRGKVSKTASQRAGEECKILTHDVLDPELSWKVLFEDGHADWYKEADVEEVTIAHQYEVTVERDRGVSLGFDVDPTSLRILRITDGRANLHRMMVGDKIHAINGSIVLTDEDFLANTRGVANLRLTMLREAANNSLDKPCELCGLNISGCWRMVDSCRGLEFWYEWDHDVEKGTLVGNQVDYRAAVTGHVQGRVIQWDVDGVFCRGNLGVEDQKPFIVDGFYSQNGAELGSFTGTRYEPECFVARTVPAVIVEPLTRIPTGVKDLEMKRASLVEQRKAVTEDQHIELPVVRDRIIESLIWLGQLSHVTSMKIHYANEAGIDQGGLRRDWFDCLGNALHQAAVKGDWELAVALDGSIIPRPSGSGFTPNFVVQFAFGRACGLAIWFGDPLTMPISTILCKFVLGAPVGCVDLQRLDPLFYEHRVQALLKPGGVAQIETYIGQHLYFVSVPTELQPVAVELCEGGFERQVTEENKKEYIRLLCEHYLCDGMREQINSFLHGFHSVFTEQQLINAGINHRELAVMVAGYSDLDPEEWRKHAQAQGNEHVLCMFWQVVESMSPEERAKLLHFVTGSSRLPVGGFSALDGIQHPKFQVYVSDISDTQQLPHARTCSNLLSLPRYTSEDVLRSKLLLAIAEAHFGFA